MLKHYHIVEINRALARHDASTVYTLLLEHFPRGQAGWVLYELIKTQHDWPKANIRRIKYRQILTHQELEVLRLSEQGLTAIEIAHKIPLGIETVKTHKKNIYSKLGVHTLAGAIHVGHELGLFPESKREVISADQEET